MPGFKRGADVPQVGELTADVRFAQIGFPVPGVQHEHFGHGIAQHFSKALVGFDDPVFVADDCDAVARNVHQLPASFGSPAQRGFIRPRCGDVVRDAEYTNQAAILGEHRRLGRFKQTARAAVGKIQPFLVASTMPRRD